MAKKKRNRPNISAETLARAKAELDHGVDEVVESASAPASTREKKSAAPQVVRSIKRSMTREELSAEYGYVLGDLQSMAILAVLLFIAMVVVSLGLESVL